MKKILAKTFAFSFLAASMLASCSSDNTTGVDTEGTETNTTESQPNMGGKTGDSAEMDSIPGDTSNTMQNNATDHSGHDHD